MSHMDVGKIRDTACGEPVGIRFSVNLKKLHSSNTNVQGASGIDARFSKLAFSYEEWDWVMKFELLIL